MALTSRISQINRALNGTADAIAQQAAERLLDARNQRVPVDTGQLRDSGTIAQVSDGVWQFREGGGAVEYAPYVEYGTGNAQYPAQPHVTPAVEIVRKEMRGIAVSEVKRVIG